MALDVKQALKEISQLASQISEPAAPAGTLKIVLLLTYAATDVHFGLQAVGTQGQMVAVPRPPPHSLNPSAVANMLFPLSAVRTYCHSLLIDVRCLFLRSLPLPMCPQ